MSEPMISVILPCYNGGPFIREAMCSILDQTHRNLELVVVNDGSRDDSLAEIKAVAREDGRVVVVSRENRGMVASLNEAIDRSTGEFIARMDADDISLPDRLSRQLAFLQERRLDFVGGSIMRFKHDGRGPERAKSYPETHDQFAASVLSLKTRLAHPTLLARAEVLKEGGYNPAYRHGEDYALWLRLVVSGKYRAGNLPDVVLRYRSHGEQEHSVNRDRVRGFKRQVFLDLMTPIVGDGEIAARVCEFWQKRGLREKWRGLRALPAWLRALQKQSFYNPAIHRHLRRRIREQLFLL